MSILPPAHDPGQRTRRVVPRRRGQTAPTTIYQTVLPEPVDTLLTSTTLTPAEPMPSFEPVALPQPTLFEQAIREHLVSPIVHRQYNRLADAICPSASPGTALALYCAASTEQTAEVLGRLACTLAERNQGRILLVDGNSSQRYLTGNFRLHAQSGLTELLSTSGVDRAIVSPTSTERLDVLARGQTPLRISPAGRKRLSGWLARARSEYQFVLCDAGTPREPLGALVGQACDAAYLVVELGQTESDAARAGMSLLGELGIRVLGCVVVDVQTRLATTA